MHPEDAKALRALLERRRRLAEIITDAQTAEAIRAEAVQMEEEIARLEESSRADPPRSEGESEAAC